MEMKSEQYKLWDREYTHNWKVKAVLEFGSPIMDVGFANGHGLESGYIRLVN